MRILTKNGSKDAEGAPDVLGGPPREARMRTGLLADPRKSALLGFLSVIVLAALVWAIYAAVTWEAPDRGLGDLDEAVRAGGEIDGGSEEGTEAASTTDADGTDEGPTGVEEEDAADPVIPGDGGKVAYRSDGAVWVAGEDGSDPVRVVELAEGEYALSPDGLALAYVDRAESSLSIIEVGRDASVVVGAAEVLRPAWSQDSQRVAYVTRNESGYEVHTADRRGGGDAIRGEGHSPAFSSGTVLFVDGPSVGQPGRLMGSTAAAVPVFEALRDHSISEFAPHASGLFYLCSGQECGEASLRFRAGSDDVQLVGPPTGEARPVRYSSLLPSPDGELLAYTRTGDDGYSRLFVVDREGGEPKELSIRRDAYPVRWTSDGERLLFIEGNAFQGEPTYLMSVRPDGTGRTELVEGAGL